jgi:hypothetical protein
MVLQLIYRGFQWIPLGFLIRCNTFSSSHGHVAKIAKILLTTTYLKFSVHSGCSVAQLGCSVAQFGVQRSSVWGAA